jgi:hypothetical protein
MNEDQTEPHSEPELYLTGDPDMDSLNRFQSLVRKQDDRAMVLSLAAFAEDTLGRLLLVYLRESKQAKELIEGFNAPFGTFSTRIKGAYTIGLLTKEQYEDLEIARRVRNAFAHDWEGISLESPDIKALIGNLHAYAVDQRPTPSDGRERLLQALTTILMELRVQITQHLKHARRAPFVGFRLTTTKHE